MQALPAFSLVDDILASHKAALGPDLPGYRNHVTRVLQFLFAIAPELRASEQPVLIAAAFCMYNRYVDGLAAITPTDSDLYDRMGKYLAENGYGRR